MSEETKEFQFSREDFVTPDQLKDDLEYSEEEIKEFDEMISQTLNDLSEGEVVLGKIVRVSKQDIAIDIGFKSEGIIDIEEFDNPEELNEGDEIDVFLESVDDGFGSVVLSHKKAEFMKIWEGVVATFENEEVITGKCIRRIKGGMVVDVKGIDAFLPGSQIDVKAIRDFDAYIGKEMEFKIVKLNHARKNVVVSHRVLIEKDMEALRAEILDTLEKGQVREGMVKNITDFGVFIDLGGVDGLLHITDLSWGRVNHPSEIVKLDQKIEVKILDYNEKKDRISLGLKQLMPHPWEKIDEKYPVGSTVNGRVVSITDYGAFVELEKGIEGLIHISEMSWSQHIKHPSQVLKIGQETEVRVLNIDPEDKKISLGIKQLEPDPWEKLEERYPAGSVHDGKVRNLTAFGAFVELEEGVDGLVHISDLSWTKKIRHPGEVVKKGDEIKVKVLDINREERRIALGHKQVEPNPWDHFEDLFKVGKTVDGTVARMVDKGVVVTLEMGVDGFVPLNHLADKNAKKALESINIGNVMTLKVIEFDKENKRIVLSARVLKEAEDKATLSGYKPDDKPATIGDFANFELKIQEEDETEAKKSAAKKKAKAEVVKEEAKAEVVKEEAKAEVVKEEKKPAAKKKAKADEVKEEAKAEVVEEEKKKPAAKKKTTAKKAETEEKKPAAKKKAATKKTVAKAETEEKKPAAKKKAAPKKTTAKDKD